MSFLSKIKGQHSIEYAVLLTLVMVGIMVTGRYVIRSWNANLKGWEDSVIDSLQDPLIEVDPTDSMGGCDPNDDWLDRGCSSSMINYCTGTNYTCSETERLETRTFSPPGCECALDPNANHRCVVDPCCCTQPAIGPCGVNATETGLGEPACNTQMTPKNSDGTCPDGMAEASRLCGGDTDPRYGCVPDASCIFECTAPDVGTSDAYGDLCRGDDTGLPSDVPNSFVIAGGCTDAKKCETECAPTFIPDPGGTFCKCPDGLILVGDECLRECVKSTEKLFHKRGGVTFSEKCVLDMPNDMIMVDMETGEDAHTDELNETHYIHCCDFQVELGDCGWIGADNGSSLRHFPDNWDRIEDVVTCGNNGVVAGLKATEYAPFHDYYWTGTEGHQIYCCTPQGGATVDQASCYWNTSVRLWHGDPGGLYTGGGCDYNAGGEVMTGLITATDSYVGGSGYSWDYHYVRCCKLNPPPPP